MLRSNAEPSEHSSDRLHSSLRSDFPVDHLTEDEQSGTEPDSDPESLAPGHPGILEFQNIMLQEVCWFHRSAALCLDAPDKRTSSARIAAMHSSSTTWMLMKFSGSACPSSILSLQRNCSMTINTCQQPFGARCLAMTASGSVLQSRRRTSSPDNRSRRLSASCWYVSSLCNLPPLPRPSTSPGWPQTWSNLCSTSQCPWLYGPCSPPRHRGKCKTGTLNMSDTNDSIRACLSSLSTPTSLTTSTRSAPRWTMSPPAPLVYHALQLRLSHPAPLVHHSQLRHPAPLACGDRRLWRRWRIRISSVRRKLKRRRAGTPTTESGLVQLLRGLHRQGTGYTNFFSRADRPGPKSGVDDDNTCPIIQHKVIEDVRVGGFEGRLPPEAVRLSPRCVEVANHYDHLRAKAESQGTVPALSPDNAPYDQPSTDWHPRILAGQPTVVRGHLCRILQGMLFLLNAPRSNAAPANGPGGSLFTTKPPHIAPSRLAKRSYKRALARQQRTGSAWYTGRLLPQLRTSVPIPSNTSPRAQARRYPSRSASDWSCCPSL